jgi:hypothetical protein
LLDDLLDRRAAPARRVQRGVDRTRCRHFERVSQEVAAAQRQPGGDFIEPAPSIDVQLGQQDEQFSPELGPGGAAHQHLLLPRRFDPGWSGQPPVEQVAHLLREAAVSPDLERPARWQRLVSG